MFQFVDFLLFLLFHVGESLEFVKNRLSPLKGYPLSGIGLLDRRTDFRTLVGPPEVP